MPINKLASYEEVELPIEETSQIPSYIKMNSDVNNPRFIADGMNEFERNIKRIGDFLLSGISLIIFSPLFVICYILVKREDGGPAIFKQERIGRFGRPFYIYKFRSMRVDAEKNGPQLFGHKKDNRMTKIGVLLRDHHLDEHPQLWNVFKGDMAFIGPRLSASSILIRLWSMILAMSISIRFAQELPPTLLSIMVILIPWRRCCEDLI